MKQLTLGCCVIRAYRPSGFDSRCRPDLTAGGEEGRSPYTAAVTGSLRKSPPNGGHMHENVAEVESVRRGPEWLVPCSVFQTDRFNTLLIE